jgi:hypothetical protein
MLISALSSRLPHLLAGCLLLGACSSAVASGGTGGTAGNLGLRCTAGDDCDTGLCVIGEAQSWCTQDCTADADCPSAMYCAWMYPDSSSRCDPLDEAPRDCRTNCDAYHSLGRVSNGVAEQCAEVCSGVTQAQAGAFVACSGPELNADSGTSCLSSLCAQAGLACP